MSDTQSDLEGVEQSMDNTAESTGDSAEELEGFSERFQGAMTAAVAALAVGAAGLLSQVPVLGEAFSGLSAIVAALAFQMDGVLRPVLSPLTGLFFDVSNAIFEADGAAGDIIGTVAAIVSALAVAVPAIAAVGSALGVWVSTSAGVISILGTLVGAVATVAGAIASIPLAIAAAIAAVVGFAAAYLTNWNGVRDKTNRIIGQIIDFVVGGFRELGRWALEAIGSFVDDAVDWFTGLAGDLASWASDIASDAYDWGADLIGGFLEGIRAFAGTVVRAFQGIINGIIGTINTALEELPEEITSRVGVEQFERVDFAGSFGASTAGGSDSARGFGGDGRGATSGGPQIDGRQLSESTGRYRSDPNRRRGL